MQLQPQLLKRHSKLWLNQQLILQELPELSEEYLRTSARFRYRQGVADCFKNADTLPDTGKHWRYSQVNGSFYYCYDNIPADKKSVLPAKADLFSRTI